MNDNNHIQDNKLKEVTGGTSPFSIGSIKPCCQKTECEFYKDCDLELIEVSYVVPFGGIGTKYECPRGSKNIIEATVTFK